MPWVVERAPVVPGSIVWLELDRNDHFILEQKLKDVSTPRGVSARKHQRKRSGSFNSLFRHADIIECKRYGYEPARIPTYLLQFRIRTTEAIYGSPIVVCVAASHKTALSKWEFIENNILSNYKACCLYNAPFRAVDVIKRNYADFLFFQFCCLANSNSMNESKENILPGSLDYVDIVSARSQHRGVKLTPEISITINQVRRFSDVISLQTYIPKDTESGSFHRLQEKLQELAETPITQTSDMDMGETILESQSCILVSSKNQRQRKYHAGILLLTTSHIGFYRKHQELGAGERLYLKLTDIENIRTNVVEEDLPQSISILHNTRNQFLFVGLDSECTLIIHLVLSWKQQITAQRKRLKRRLQKQTIVYFPLEEQDPTELRTAKIISFFKKGKEKDKKQLSSPSVTPTTTKLPIFSLAPCTQETAESERCFLQIAYHIPIPIPGRFYLTSEGGTFMSKKHTLMFTMSYSTIKSISYAFSCHSSTPNIEVSLNNFEFPLQLSELSQELTNRWMRGWFLIRDERATEQLLYYSQFFDEQSDDDLIELKQRCIESQIKASTQEYIHYWQQYKQSNADAAFRTNILKRLVYIGIPNEIRGEWWCRLVRVDEKMKGEDEVPYGYMLSQFIGMESVETIEIERDAHRSLPEHDYYSPEESGCHILQSVLTAYSWRNPSIGYCQSMNLVCAALLLYMSEEQAYTVLCIICGSFLFHYPEFW